MGGYLILNNTHLNNQNQWISYISEQKHIVTLTGDNRLLVDGKFIKQINPKHIVNYEYRFKIGDTECALIKLTYEKSYRLVVDGKYVGIEKEYVPLGKLIYSSFVLIALAFVSFGLFIYLYIRTDKNPFLSILYSALAGLIFVGDISGLKYLANCPCKIKRPVFNKLFRLLIMVFLIAVSFGIMCAIYFWG